MKPLQKLAGVLSVCFVAPIWIYLLYFLLKNSSADRLVWFLFIIYIPAHFLLAIITKLTEEK